jgi:microcin C transport system substrate-binding protein
VNTIVKRAGSKCLVSLVAAFLLAAPVQSATKSHGLSAFGDLKYPADFKHFDYVNPDAPKGGRLATIGTAAILTFNSFNPFVVRDDAAQGLTMLFDSLMERSADEPDAVYGLIAHSAEVADDKRSVTFYMRPEAKFRDGTPVTAGDVVFSFEKLRDPAKAHPGYASTLRDVAKAEALDPHTVRFSFNGDNLRDLPQVVAGLPILSKAYYDTRDFYKPGLDQPMASGPYEIGAYNTGVNITYKRRPDYWAANLPVNKGRFNFDEIRYEYYRDRTAGMEAFKAGAYDLREEFTSKTWATEYNFPAVKEGRVIKDELPDGSLSGTQGFWYNTRRSQFADPKVRKALVYAFDFEWLNKNLFFGLYQRTHSYFTNSDMEAKGKPSEAELKILEPFKDKLPPEVFDEVFVPPVSDGTGRDRNMIREAKRLLTEAGWTVNQAGVLVNAKGEPFRIEFLIDEPTSEKIYGFYIEKLRQLGIQTSARNVDAAQMEVRQKEYDFDIESARFTLSPTPGPELRVYWGSEAAKTKGTANFAGIADPVVDALIDKILQAKTRDELRTTAMALDRVLRAGHYWVPNWYKAKHTIAHWDRYSRPAIKPKFDRGVLDTWWYDAAKAAKIGK